MLKTIECPRCQEIFTTSGEFQETKKVICPRCNLEGKVSFKSSDKYIIEAQNLHKIYDGGKIRVHALQGVSLQIKKGEMVAIMGVSGCGKTTLLNCLSGLDSLTEGSILIEGRNLNAMSDEEKTDYRATKMGFIFQFYNLLPVLSAIENVELPLLVAKIKPAVARKRALEALKMVGLDGWESHKPSELSGGQRQRVTIARSLVNHPLIVFGDEPTGDLDSKTSEEIMNLLCRLNAEYKQTFILVTHDSKIAEKTHRVLVMGSGVIKKEYRPMLR
ncbi:MAG: ABC transporter ATP-binding protein [Candidatus Thermoplasmatota archaeon]|nr:ABC transporter ATP-binding protein [Candidatus Thermoplasmatota archaeon]